VLNALKNSARNSKENRSVSRVIFEATRSTRRPENCHGRIGNRWTRGIDYPASKTGVGAGLCIAVCCKAEGDSNKNDDAEPIAGVRQHRRSFRMPGSALPAAKPLPMRGQRTRHPDTRGIRKTL
jgi:hypothetical protein